MGRQGVALLAAACLAWAAAHPAAAGPREVAVRREKLTLPWYTGRTEAEPSDARRPKRPFRPAPDSMRRAGDRTFDTIVLESDFLRVQVIPEVGGVVHRCIYKPTGTDLFFREKKAKDWLPFWESGVKASFPFREHGIRTDQPASWRIVRGADGSATLAMWMEFSRFDGWENRHSYGRFADMTLSQFVTLAPAEATFTVTYRVANPAPWRQGWKVWNDALFPRQHTPAGVVHGDARPPGTTDTQIIQPVAWFSGHNGGGLRRWNEMDARIANHLPDHISTFAWDVAAGFAGLWYPSVRVNRLRVFDPKQAPGTKFYFRGEGQYHPGHLSTHMYNFIELWGGPHRVFEGVEDWIGPGEARQITHRFAYVDGIGRADFANRHAALHVQPDVAEPFAEIVTFRPRTALKVFCDGKTVAAGLAAAPGRAARVDLPARAKRVRLVLLAGDEVLVDRTLPLEIPDDRTSHERVAAALSFKTQDGFERSGVPAAWGRSIFRAAYPAGSLGRGRVAYFLGHLDQAVADLREFLAADPDGGEGWHLLGGALLEGGKASDAKAAFQRAARAKDPYPPARYFLALAAIADARRGEAVEQLRQLAAAVPAHWHGRLLAAYLAATSPDQAKRSAGPARLLAAEDPADPRAQYVLWKAADAAGDKAAARAAESAFRSMMAEPGAAERLDQFVAATTGRYAPPRRVKMPPDTRLPTAETKPAGPTSRPRPAAPGPLPSPRPPVPPLPQNPKSRK